MVIIRFNKVNFKGLKNTRDVGQVYTTDGRKVKSNVLYRSGRIDKISNKRIKEFLQTYNIKTVIDLRTQTEVRESKHFQYPTYINYYHIPVLNKQFFGITHENNSMARVMLSQKHKITECGSGEEYMISMYENIIFDKTSQQHFKTLFDILCHDLDGAVLYHCTGGKDRTGITTLYLYTLLGVSEDDILEDFATSDIFNAKYNRTRETLIKIFMPTSKRTKALLIALLHAKRVYLETAINKIKEKYGSVLNFLFEEIKITPEMQEKLKENFLEK